MQNETAVFSQWRAMTHLGDAREIVWAINQDTRLELFARSSTGTVVHNWQTATGKWRGWESMPTSPTGVSGNLVAQRNALASRHGSLELFALDGDGHVIHTYQSKKDYPTGWSRWQAVTQQVVRAMAVGPQASTGDLIVFACDDDHVTWSSQAEGWARRHDMGPHSPTGDALRVASNADGRLAVFLLQAGTVLHAAQEGDGQLAFGDWASLGSPNYLPIAQVEAGSYQDGRILLVARVEDGGCWTIAQQAGSASGWGTWTKLTALPPAAHASLTSASGHLQLGLVDLDGTAWVAQATGPRSGFAAPVPLGTPPGATVRTLALAVDNRHGVRAFAATKPGSVFESEELTGAAQRDRVTGLAPWVCPVLHVHPDEEYLPSSAPWFLDRVEYVTKKHIEGPPVTPAILPRGPHSAGTYVQFSDKYPDVAAGDLDGAQAYVHPIACPDIPGGVDYQVWAFYPFNGHATIRLIYRGSTLDIPVKFGAHQGDWEGCVVRTDAWGRVIGVYASQHDSGTWYPPSTIDADGYDSTPSGQPILYSALDGHPAFAQPGDYPTHGLDFTVKFEGYRIGGWSNNACAAGPAFDTGRHHAVIAIDGIPLMTFDTPWWADWHGRWGLRTTGPINTDEVAHLIDGYIRHGWGIPEPVSGLVAKGLAKLLVKAWGTVKGDGPEAPIEKGWWKKVPSGGPTRAGEQPDNDLAAAATIHVTAAASPPGAGADAEEFTLAD